MRLIARTAALFGLLLIVPTTGAETTLKRPIRPSDYDAWRSLQTPQLTRDGRFVAYALLPQEGDGEVIVRRLADNQEWRFPVGGRSSAEEGEAAATPGTTTPEPATPGAPPAPGPGRRGAGAAAVRLQFTADSRYLLFLIRPTRGEVEAARAAKKPPAEQPRMALGLVDLTSGKLNRIESVRSFQLPEDASNVVAYQRETRPEPGLVSPATAPGGSTTTPRRGGGPRGAAPGGTTTPAATPTAPTGSDLILRTLADGREQIIADVGEFSFSKDGRTLVYSVISRHDARNGVFAQATDTEAPPVPLLTGYGRYSRLTWDEGQQRLAFLSSRESAADGPATGQSQRYRVYLWERGRGPKLTVLSRPSGVQPPQLPPLSVSGHPIVWFTPSPLELRAAEEVIGPQTPGLPPGWIVTESAGLSFARDGSMLFLSTAPAPSPATTTPAGERVSLDLWHWKDDYIPPMQRLRAGAETARSYRAVYHVKNKTLRQLATQETGPVTAPESGRFALASDDRAYRRQVGYGANQADYALVDLQTGTRRPLLSAQEFGASLSPNGTCAVWFDGKDWCCADCGGGGAARKLTAGLKAPFAQEEDDTPDPAPSYGVAGWGKDDKCLLLNDRYDIWMVNMESGEVRNLTGGLGRQTRTQFRLVRLDPKERGIDMSKPLILRAESEETRDTGFWRLEPGAARPEKLAMGARNFAFVQKARDADVVLLTASTFADYPDLQVTDMSFKELRRVSDANPQKKKLLWGTAERVRYKNLDGVELKATLYKPENFSPGKKYPLMVYIYERLSQGMHRFRDPAVGTSINVPTYVSNGYLVLEPDIVYTVGYPGQSALKCVLPAIQAVVDTGCVDENAIGIQGHSWGGYQIAYMVTQTGRFKAAVAGAPVANMTSAYDGIRWGTGLPRQFQYERTQSRIGGTLWQYPTRFIENSPVFMADRVKTPLLMLHNDQDDAVPWYQGIEYFLALRRLGKEVYLCNYNGELHGLRRRPNQKDWSEKMLQFFDYHLRGAPAPAWMEKGGTPSPFRGTGQGTTGVGESGP